MLDLFQHLEPGGKFLLKDIDAADKPQLLFTYLLDLLMSPRDPYSYRTAAAWQGQLRATGFSPVYLHRMRDILPYPHIFFISSKPGQQIALTALLASKCVRVFRTRLGDCPLCLAPSQ